ncbi:DUF1467 family protein [Pelagibius sp. 7325]|uniref:DUF1467 family protein n=1 Tax=Pelagibius sp. 7325 TaxID=3131994 RepID=UPI0030EF2324
MNWFTGVLVYGMVWIVVLLTVLPWGVRPPDAPETGHEPGAPEKPMLVRKFVVTSLISLAIWGAIYVVIDQGWISFRDSVDPFVKPGATESTPPGSTQ